jgi:calcium permeable stress-gated cation channel
MLIPTAIAYSVIAPLVLGFATIGLGLLYIGYRYNILFVYNLNIDTRGLIYPRALKQILTGIYLSQICLIGLLAVKKAIAPLILEVVILVVTVLFHLSLNSAYDPLLNFLPLTLETEEEALLSLEHGHEEEAENAEKNGKNGTVSEGVKTGSTDDEKDLGATRTLSAPQGATKKPNFFSKWLHPDIYCDYYTMRRMVPKNGLEISYTEELEASAYYNPAIASPTPLLWIPRDQLGISKQEIAHTSKVIPITDESAEIDEKGTISFNHDVLPPVYQAPTYF